MKEIFETVYRVIAHMCERNVFDSFCVFDRYRTWDSCRAIPMPTIDDLNKFQPSTFRALCKYIIRYDIRNQTIYNIIAQMISNPESPITHEFVIEYTLNGAILVAYCVGDGAYIHTHINGDYTLFYILNRFYTYKNGCQSSIKYKFSDEIDIEFKDKLMKVLISGTREEAYALMAKQFKQRGLHTKSAHR